MRGIILAGGRGTRLYPATLTVSKQLLPVYDKPMVYYALSTLMLAGIRDILVIVDPENGDRFERLLGHGGHLGVSIRYATQARPEGIAQALVIGEEFAADEPVGLILGDNVFVGPGLDAPLRRAAQTTAGAVIFGYQVEEPERFGIVELDDAKRVISLEEKPTAARSRWAVPGLYFYDGEAAKIARSLRPSERGELEITDINLEYLRRRMLGIELLDRDVFWLDTGTPDSLLAASLMVQKIERSSGINAGCIEEIAYRMGYISGADLERLADASGTSRYADYLRRVATRDLWSKP